ncbi:MAG: M20/M25/M40 family metallo-hydrolase [Chloroflexi bacterium]|nr:M20/M25/M40 family metallo-hydrolase [Chloroflexota bacterium]
MINEHRLVQTFLELVQIDSPSGDEQQIAECVAESLRARGAQVKLDSLHNVIAFVPGRGVKQGVKPLFLNAHTDNVAPARGIKPIVAGGQIASDGTTVLGADDLAGVAAILEAAASLAENDKKHLPLEIAITSQEELGLVGAKGLDLQDFHAKEGVVLDSGGPVGAIVLASPTQNLVEITIKGKAAHSARPEGSINALKIAAAAIARTKLGKLDRDSTANFGIVRGGMARNIVPDKVEIVGEVRSRNTRKLERHTRAMKQGFERTLRGTGAKLEFRVTRAYNRYEFGKNDRLVQRVARVLKQLGRTPRYEMTMGGSDANIWNAKGIKAVVVSVGYEQIHTPSEYLPVAELVKAAELVETLALV